MRIETNPEAYDRVKDAASVFLITSRDLAGPVLVRLGQIHRAQEKRIFASEGEEGGAGSWAPLHPDYKKFKTAVLGPGPKILVWNGDMKDRFITFSRPEYVQEFLPNQEGGGVFLFGARSQIAFQHKIGAFVDIKPMVGRDLKTGKKVVWPSKELHVQLPVRDMVTKTPGQLEELRNDIWTWYRDVRIPQAVRALAAARAKANRGFAGGPGS